jgi:uncharacterized protein YjbJ (UPF0337 family)
MATKTKKEHLAMINQQTLQGNWNEIKGTLKERWGELTQDDLRAFNGNVDQLVGMIQKKTGEARDVVQKYLEEITTDTSSAIGKAAQTARDYTNRATETMHDTYGQVAGRVRDGYSEAEHVVRTRPAESVAVAFGAGLLIGVITGLVLRSR